MGIVCVVMELIGLPDTDRKLVPSVALLRFFASQIRPAHGTRKISDAGPFSNPGIFVFFAQLRAGLP